MINYALLILLLLYLISKICYTEYYENRLSDYYVNVVSSADKNQCNSYKFYHNDKLIIESGVCKWGKEPCLKSTMTLDFNNKHDDVEINKTNHYSYDILLDGKKKARYQLHKNDINNYHIFDENDNKIYNVYRSIVDNKESITIRNNRFDSYATITGDLNKYSNKFYNPKSNTMKFDYKTTHKDFNNQEILGYSIFKTIHEINRDFYK
jgi:hypothetical protein